LQRSVIFNREQFIMSRIFPFVFLSFFIATQLSAQQPERQSGQTPERRQLISVAEPFERLSEVFRLSTELVGKSVVHIEATQFKSVNPSRSGRSIKMQVEESGSGIVVTVSGKQVILTNRHVVGGIELSAVKILTHDRRLLTPNKITTNEDFDLAVIEVSETLPVSVLFGDSNGVRVGDMILVMGSPFGLDRSVSMGIVSAVNRRDIPSSSGQTPRVGFFQTDAAVNPGSSGGPMFNLHGEVLGLVTAIATQGGGSDGVAFVLPGKYVLRVAEQLVRDGSVVKPYIGAGFDPDFRSEKRKELGLDRQIGARILRLVPDSPASQTGLCVGDVILSFDGNEVEDDVHVINLVAQSEIDKPVKLIIFRDGQNTELSVTPSAQISR
jgi:serine protease Do